MNSLNIRKARRSDLKKIQELNYQLFVHDKVYDLTLNINWPYEKVGEEYFKDRIGGKNGVCFVAEIKDEIVGYLAGALTKPYSYRNVGNLSELENTLVKEEFRGKKIGEELFKEFLKWSKEEGAVRIKVSASADNSRAIKFYKRIGFVPYVAEMEYEIK